MKILMNPTLEVVDGQTAKITGTDNSIEITPTIRNDGNIVLQINLDLSLESAGRDKEQTPITSKHKISTKILLSPGESGIIGDMKQAGLLTGPGRDANDSEAPAKEMLVILTPTVVKTASNQERKTELPAEVEPDKILSKLARIRAFFTQPVNRTINTNAERTNCLIDFDNDRILSLPSDFNSRNRQQQQAWKQENGIDASASVSQGEEGLWGEEMVVIPVANEEFDRINPSSFRTFLTQATLATPAVMTAIGQLPKTYVFKTRERGMGLLQISEVQRKRSPHYIKIRYKMVPRTSDADAKITSNRMLQDLGKAMVSFAGDHQRTLPNRMEDFAPYLRNKQDIEWLGQNVEYLGKGKSENDRPDTVIAYDRSLLQSQQGTNVLFLDAHVEFLTPERLKELGIKKAATIIIETRILTVSDEFLNYVGLDPNSLEGSAWVENAPFNSGEPFTFTFDELIVDLLLKAVKSRKDYTLLSRPKILAMEGKQTDIAVVSQAHFIEIVNEPNGSSEAPTTRTEKLQFGTFIKLTPELMPDGKNIALDLEIEVRRLGDFEQDKYKGKYLSEIPPVSVSRNKMKVTVSDGDTLPIVGQRIVKPVLLTQQEALQQKALWSNMNPIRAAFRKSSSVKEPGRLLILVKPIISPEEKADI